MKVEIKTNRNDGYVFHIIHDNFFGILRLGSTRSYVYAISRGKILDHFKLYGFKGALNLSEDFIKKIKNHKLSSITNFKMTIKLLKSEVYKALSKIINNDPEFTYKHRQVLIKILLNNKISQKYMDPSAKWHIPVHVMGVGVRKLRRLKSKDVFVTRITNQCSRMKTKAQLAASMGYHVICARTLTEKRLIMGLLDAHGLNELPNTKLSSIKAVEKLSKSEKQLLSNGHFVLNSLVSSKVFNIKPDEVRTDLEVDMSITEGPNLPIHSTLNGIETGTTKGTLIKHLKLGLCRLPREDINALTNVRDCEIFLNLNSPIIKLMTTDSGKTQMIMLLEELSHEFAHILGYGVQKHDLEFFKMQRILKYKCLLKL